MSSPSNPRRSAARPLAEMIGTAIAPALAAKGFAGREVVGNWAEIVGERLAARSRPLKIDWPKRSSVDGDKAEPATLVVLVESAFAPEIQHAAPVILARINAHLGWSAVGRIVLRQGPVLHDKPASRAVPVPSADTAARIAGSADRIREPGLKEAMTRLGLAVAGKAAAKRQTGENV